MDNQLHKMLLEVAKSIPEEYAVQELIRVLIEWQNDHTIEYKTQLGILFMKKIIPDHISPEEILNDYKFFQLSKKLNKSN